MYCMLLCCGSLAVPLNCNDGTSCISISPEKLLDRIIQHAELLYRVSEESSTLFVSVTLALKMFYELYDSKSCSMYSLLCNMNVIHYITVYKV